MKWSVIFAAFAAALAFSSPDFSAQDVDKFIKTELPSSVVPALAYSRIENGEIVARSFGESVAGSGRPVDEDSLFPIGSLTKSFTALAVMQLVEKGQVELDAPLGQYLTAFSEGKGAAVTIRQLLNHSSGYSTVQGNRRHGADGRGVDTLAANGRQLAKLGPAHDVGTTFAYSNANYQLLGALIEEVTGSAYEDYVKRQIFEPLGMTDSQIWNGPPPSNLVTGHRPWFGKVRSAANHLGDEVNAPAGGIISSAADMGRYLAFWLRDDDRLVSRESRALMTRSSSPASPYYGFGWSIDPNSGNIYHSGLVPGAEALATFNPATDRGAVVLINANGGLGFADTWHLIGGVAARAMGEEHGDEGSRKGPKAAYLSIAILPVFFLLANMQSWRGRSSLRGRITKRAGRLSLWLPLPLMLALSLFLLVALPALFGGSFQTLLIYQPDFAYLLMSAAVLAPIWALFRLGLAYSMVNFQKTRTD